MKTLPPRFEEQVEILLVCCQRPMRLGGNLSLRGPAKFTSLSYECRSCFRCVTVIDETHYCAHDPAIAVAHDAEP